MADDEKKSAAEEEEEKPRKRKTRKWDEETRDKYEDEMETIIYDRIADYRLDSDEIEKFVDEIVDIANSKLKGARVRSPARYIYWTTVFVCTNLAHHKNQRGMSYWTNDDHAICIQAKNEHLRVVLTSYLVCLQ